LRITSAQGHLAIINLPLGFFNAGELVIGIDGSISIRVTAAAARKFLMMLDE
jgi:hypothetical protein